MKKLAAITLAALILLSACGKSTPHESEQTTEEMTGETAAVETNEEITIQTTRELTEEEVSDLEEMPEIVFLLIHNGNFSGNTAEGLFIDNNGIIKEFSLSYDQFPPWSNENLDELADKIITNYDNLIEYSEDTGRRVEISELTTNWELLREVDLESEIRTMSSPYDSIGCSGYHGIKINTTGELTVIPLKGSGDWFFRNTDPVVIEIRTWFAEAISTDEVKYIP
ncbi:MAG: hypothetical protein FWG90_10375 [Oscillospiraceae bacterium]|nr:hypothetical protein [Oscillospiraceae bacterium]